MAVHQNQDSLPVPFAYQSKVRTPPSAHPAETRRYPGFFIAVLKSPSQQVRRELAVGEPFLAVVPPLAVNSYRGKTAGILGFSARYTAAESEL